MKHFRLLFGLLVWSWLAMTMDARAEVDTVYTASYNGHGLRIEVESGFLENQYKVYLDNSQIGAGKIVGMGGLNKVTATVDGKKLLVTLKQGVLSPEVNLFINGAEVALTH